MLRNVLVTAIEGGRRQYVEYKVAVLETLSGADEVVDS